MIYTQKAPYMKRLGVDWLLMRENDRERKREEEESYGRICKGGENKE